jgi:ERCC4-type nuclease
MSTVPKGGKGEPTGATIMDKRTMLTVLPVVNEPMAHQLLACFKTLSGVLSADEAQLAAMSSIKPEHARRLFRLFQCVRGHSTYS